MALGAAGYRAEIVLQILLSNISCPFGFAWSLLEHVGTNDRTSQKVMEGHGKLWKLVEYSVSVTIYQHLCMTWRCLEKLLELSHPILYQLNILCI